MLRPEEQVLADIQEFTKQAMREEPLQKEAQAWMKAKSLWRNLLGKATGRGAIQAIRSGPTGIGNTFGGKSSIKDFFTGKGSGGNVLDVVMPWRMYGRTSRAADQVLRRAMNKGINPATNPSVFKSFAQKELGNSPSAMKAIDKAMGHVSNPAAQNKWLRNQAFDLRGTPEKLTKSHAMALKPSEFKAFKDINTKGGFNRVAKQRSIPSFAETAAPPVAAGGSGRNAQRLASKQNLMERRQARQYQRQADASKSKADFIKKRKGNLVKDKGGASGDGVNKSVTGFEKAYERSAGAWNDPGLQKAWNNMSPANRQQFMTQIRQDATMGRSFEKLQTFGWGSLNPVEKAKLMQAGAGAFVGQRLLLKDEAII